MKVAALLIFFLSHQGYWLSGQEQAVTARWAAREAMPPSDLVWELGLGPVKLGGGSAAMNAGAGPATITIKCPAVRVRTTLRWSYRLVGRDDRKVLESGEQAVYAFPADLTADWARRVDGRKLVVWDDADGLPKILEAAGVPFTRVDDLAKVLDRPDLILVGPGRIDESPFSQGPLLNFARAGSGVAVLEQKKPDRLAGYALARRELPADIAFKAGHPLFDRLTPSDLRSWAAGGREALWAVQLPADEPALELAWWARESAGEEPAPIDALAVTRSIGEGRIVLCQIALGPWGRDPRSQILAGNLLSYLATRPEPTPPPSGRREPRPAAPQTVPTIDISPGARP